MVYLISSRFTCDADRYALFCVCLFLYGVNEGSGAGLSPVKTKIVTCTSVLIFKGQPLICNYTVLIFLFSIFYFLFLFSKYCVFA